MPKITIPNPSLVILCGPAGSGKSTFARRFFPETTVVSSDRCRALLSDDESNISISRDAFELFHFIIDRRLRLGRLTVADSTAVRREARRALLRIGRRHGVPVVVIVFDVPEDVCYHHDTQRRRRVGRAVITKHQEELREALPAIPQEGFDQVIILGAEDLRHTSVDIVPASPRRAGIVPATEGPD
ncbi:MAG: AAA family ATPase [Armatimonadetes bacterium]|nr:AAA family ATPase [Armatimonadota bacterium]